MKKTADFSPHILVVTGFSDIAEAHMFIGLAQRGCKISIISEPGAKFNEAFAAAGMDVIPLKIKGRFDRAARTRIRALCIEKKIQLVHAMNNRAVANALAATRGLKLRFIAYRGIEGNDSYWDPLSWQTYLHPRVDRVICVADAIRRFLVGLSLLGYRQPASKFITIYKGHDLAWYNQPRTDLTEFGVPQDAFVIGSVANDRPRKGIPLLVEAFNQLSALPQAHLVLVGSMESPALQQQITASPFAERIHYLGQRQDAPSLMSACDVYVLPAIKREGLPKTVIEAMAYGRVPVVTASGGSPELIEEGISGLIVPPGDVHALSQSLLKLASMSANEREQMGLAAQQRLVKCFHTQDTVTKTRQVYQELLAL